MNNKNCILLDLIPPKEVLVEQGNFVILEILRTSNTSTLLSRRSRITRWIGRVWTLGVCS